MTIPEERVKRALLNVERREVIKDLAQINAAILHLLSGGKSNYDVAKNLSDKETDYSKTSDEILSALESRRQERENRLKLLSDDLALLDEEP
jgi:t-SNARE complex subunit (syntaxin)